MQDHGQAREFQSGDCVIRPATRRLLRDGAEVELEAKVFDLILLLVRDHARALDKQELIEKLWGKRPITDAALSQLIYKARRACGDDGDRQAVIRTIYGRGLQWVAPVREVILEPPAPAATADADEPRAQVPAPDATPVSRMRRRRAWPIAAAVALLAIGVALAWWLVPRGAAQGAPDLPRVALLPIENATGDATLGWTARGVPGLIGSLLDSARGLDVVDPLQVARAWEYTPGKGESRADHTRTVTHAAVLVSGRLRKLADLYELTLHVDAGPGRSGSDVTLTGSEPGALAVAAVPRLRNALNPGSRNFPTSGATPEDPFVAQTFARGMDAAMHGRWSDAKPYFAVVAKADPDFLPGRYRLGQAQIRTDQPDAAQTTLREVLSGAGQRNAPDIAAQSLKELAYVAQLRHAFADAIQLLEQARPFAGRARNPEVQAQIALALAQAQASLKQNDAALQSLAAARTLIDRNALVQLRPTLHGAEIFIANGRDDFAALEKAARASLAADQAIGDERGAATSLFNIAYAMENSGRRVEALPLWAQTWHWAREHQDGALEIWSGWYLASGLFNTGWDDRAATVNDAVLAASRRQHNASSESLALRLRAGLEWNRGDPVAALRTCREANALIDGENDPATLLEGWAAEAFVAFAVRRADVVELAARADALIARQPDPASYRFRRAVFAAMRTAVSGNAEDTRQALAAARAAASAELETVEVRQTALNIALVTGDAQTAATGLRDLDLSRTSDALLLQLAGRWAAKRGDVDLARGVAGRQKSLRDSAAAVLGELPSGGPAIARDEPGT